MNREERSDRLSRALRELESRPASPGFTERVLERIEAGDRNASPIRLRWAAVAAAVALLAIGVVALTRLDYQPAASATRAQQLEHERDQLLNELQALERGQRPVVYLGTSSDYDLVLDLDPLLVGTQRAPVVPGLRDLRLQRPDVRNASRRQP